MSKKKINKKVKIVKIAVSEKSLAYKVIQFQFSKDKNYQEVLSKKTRILFRYILLLQI